MCISGNALFVDTTLVTVLIGCGANMSSEVRLLAVVVVSIILEAFVPVAVATTVLIDKVSDDTTGGGFDLCAGIDMYIYSDTMTALALELAEEVFACAWETYSC